MLRVFLRVIFSVLIIGIGSGSIRAAGEEQERVVRTSGNSGLPTTPGVMVDLSTKSDVQVVNAQEYAQFEAYQRQQKQQQVLLLPQHPTPGSMPVQYPNMMYSPQLMNFQVQQLLLQQQQQQQQQQLLLQQQVQGVMPSVVKPAPVNDDEDDEDEHRDSFEQLLPNEKDQSLVRATKEKAKVHGKKDAKKDEAFIQLQRQFQSMPSVLSALQSVSNVGVNCGVNATADLFSDVLIVKQLERIQQIENEQLHLEKEVSEHGGSLSTLTQSHEQLQSLLTKQAQEHAQQIIEHDKVVVEHRELNEQQIKEAREEFNQRYEEQAKRHSEEMLALGESVDAARKDLVAAKSELIRMIDEKFQTLWDKNIELRDLIVKAQTEIKQLQNKCKEIDAQALLIQDKESRIKVLEDDKAAQQLALTENATDIATLKKQVETLEASIGIVNDLIGFVSTGGRVALWTYSELKILAYWGDQLPLVGGVMPSIQQAMFTSTALSCVGRGLFRSFGYVASGEGGFACNIAGGALLAGITFGFGHMLSRGITTLESKDYFQEKEGTDELPLTYCDKTLNFMKRHRSPIKYGMMGLGACSILYLGAQTGVVDLPTPPIGQILAAGGKLLWNGVWYVITGCGDAIANSGLLTPGIIKGMASIGITSITHTANKITDY